MSDLERWADRERADDERTRACASICAKEGKESGETEYNRQLHAYAPSPTRSPPTPRPQEGFLRQGTYVPAQDLDLLPSVPSLSLVRHLNPLPGQETLRLRSRLDPKLSRQARREQGRIHPRLLRDSLPLCLPGLLLGLLLGALKSLEVGSGDGRVRGVGRGGRWSGGGVTR